MANKYLDGAGLDHMWDKVKAYLGNNYAAKSHTHTIAQITSLQTILDGKANSSHTHTSSQITDLNNNGYLKMNSPVSQDFGYTSTSGQTKTYTIPAMNVNTITPYLVKATINGTTESLRSITVTVKAPSGGQYVIGGIKIAGGATVASQTKKTTMHVKTATASVNGQLTRIS